MKKINYRQCKLSKTNETQISWIPEKFAVVGKILKLKNHHNEWEDGWLVESAGNNLVSEEFLPDSHDEIKQHRKNTGDSLRK